MSLVVGVGPLVAVSHLLIFSSHTLNSLVTCLKSQRIGNKHQRTLSEALKEIRPVYRQVRKKTTASESGTLKSLAKKRITHVSRRAQLDSWNRAPSCPDANVHAKLIQSEKLHERVVSKRLISKGAIDFFIQNADLLQNANWRSGLDQGYHDNARNFVCKGVALNVWQQLCPVEVQKSTRRRPATKTNPTQYDIPKRLGSSNINSFHQNASNASHFRWVIYWDIENVHLPRKLSAQEFLARINKKIQHIHAAPIFRVVIAANMTHQSGLVQKKLKNLSVTKIHVESRRNKDAADKALITEMCFLPRDLAPPSGIVVVSGDSDFSYAVGKLKELGYLTVIVSGGHHERCGAHLRQVANFVLGANEVGISSSRSTHPPAGKQRKGVLADDSKENRAVPQRNPPVRDGFQKQNPRQFRNPARKQVETPVTSLQTKSPRRHPKAVRKQVGMVGAQVGTKPKNEDAPCIEETAEICSFESSILVILIGLFFGMGTAVVLLAFCLSAPV